MTDPAYSSTIPPKNRTPILLTSVCIIAICGILYELLISTISSYFQGSSVLHFSITIGLFLSFMGVGSYLSRYIKQDLLAWFIRFEWWLGLIGGLSSFILYASFALTPYFYGIAFLLIAILGSLIGIEIPLLTRMVSRHESLKDAMAKVLSFDYIGALFASVAFPLLLLPFLGIMRTAFVVGLLNIAVALMNTFVFQAELKSPKRFYVNGGLIAFILLVGFGGSFQLTHFFETFLYRDPVVYSSQSPYQQLTLTRWNKDVRLFINGNLQFSTLDEYRYHEALTHIPVALANQPQKILVLGGGDGLAIRELRKYDFTSEIILVDLDPAMTELGMNHPIIQQINENSIRDTRIKVINQDAFQYLENLTSKVDLIIVDLPDPHETSLGKLYSQSFYQLIERHLNTGGVVVTQSTSPYFAPNAFWCIHETLRSVMPATFAYHTYVPSFGQWGFNVAVKRSPKMIHGEQAINPPIKRLQRKLREANLTLKYLTPEVIPSLFLFDGDTQKKPVEINRLDNQILIQYYEQSWAAWD